MPEAQVETLIDLKTFPKGYDYATRQFRAYVLGESYARHYPRFIYDPNMVQDTRIQPGTPVFFINTEQAGVLLEIFEKHTTDWRPTQQQRAIIQELADRLPSGDMNRWQLIVEPGMAALVVPEPEN